MPSSVLPVITDNGLHQVEPGAFLERRMYKKGNSTGVQMLVHWEDQDVNATTWEDFEDFTLGYLTFSL